MQPIRHRIALMTCVILIAGGTARAGTLYVQTNLVSDGAVPAEQTEANLQNPWGMSFSTSSRFWTSDQASNVNGSPVATLFSVPAASGGLTAAPTLATFGVMNQGNAPPSGNTTNGPTGHWSCCRSGER